MKKRNLKKLELKKMAISKLIGNELKGAAALPTYDTCGDTIYYSNCYGNRNCRIFATDADCEFSFR
jgi:hypothetical protein